MYDLERVRVHTYMGEDYLEYGGYWALEFFIIITN
jgi:hypothetical protein